MRSIALLLVVLLAVVWPSGRRVEPIMVGNAVARQYCDAPEKRLYERDGAYFCAPYGWRWHGDTPYVALGDTAPLQKKIADAMALAMRLSGSRTIQGGAPELILVLATQSLDRAAIRSQAAAAGATLADKDAKWVEELVARNLKQAAGGGSTMGYPLDGTDHSVSVLDARHDRAAAAQDDFLEDDIRDDVLGHFSISRPQHEPDENECDLEMKSLGALAPPVLTEGTEGHWCGAKALYKQDAGFFCAPYPRAWPREASYAVVCGQDTFAAEIATSIARIRRLTGRQMIQSTPPDMLVLLTDNPSSEADLKTAMAKAGLKPRPEKAAADMDAISRLLAMRLEVAKADDPGLVARANTFPMLTRSCADVRLNDVIKTRGRSHSDVAKDIDDAFLQFFDISAPNDRSDGVLRVPVAVGGRPPS